MMKEISTTAVIAGWIHHRSLRSVLAPICARPGASKPAVVMRAVLLAGPAGLVAPRAGYPPSGSVASWWVPAPKTSASGGGAAPTYDGPPSRLQGPDVLRFTSPRSGSTPQHQEARSMHAHDHS